MMKNMSRVVKVAALVVISQLGVWRASADDVALPVVISGEPVMGQWYGYSTPSNGVVGSFSNVLQLAKMSHVPVLVLWSNTGCNICRNFEQDTLNTSAIQDWMATRNVAFLYYKGNLVKNTDTAAPDCQMAFEFTRKAGASFPMYRFIWYKSDGTVVDSGAGGTFAEYTPAQFTNRMEKLLAGYDNQGSLNPYRGGAFECGDDTNPLARLEAEPSTEWVEVPLLRKIVTMAYTNELVATFPNGAAVTNRVEWEVGQTNAHVKFTGIDAQYQEGAKVELVLRGVEEDEVWTNAITYVAAPDNSTQNPWWIGEKTVDDLPFGQWTMDLDVATNKVAATEDSAYTLVLFTGALWCPWCNGFDKGVWEKDEFKDFVRTNNIALVEIEATRRVESNAVTAPTLMRHEIDAARTGKSGSSYLSRKMITIPQAEDVLERTRVLGYQTWKTPSSVRTGYPTVLLLRKDGTIAGRMSYSATSDYEFDLEANLQRLREMLTLVDDPEEEANNDLATTRAELSVGAVTNGTLQASDTTDIFKLTGVRGGSCAVSVSGPESANVTLSIQKVTAAGTQILSRVSGDWSTNVLTVAADGVDGENCFVVLQGASSSFVSLGNTAWTVKSYTLTVDPVLVPQETDSFATFPAGTSVGLQIVENQIYRLEPSAGLTANIAELEQDADDTSLFHALTTGTTTLGLAAGGRLEWRVWKPGTLGFNLASLTVSETTGTVHIAVSRTNGTSGACSVQVSVDPLQTTAVAGERFTSPAGTVLTWNDGETGVKTFDFIVLDDLIYTGTEMVGLMLSVTAGHAALDAAKTNLLISITENDKAIPGRLAFTGSTPALAKITAPSVVARESTTVELEVSRVEGAYGVAAAALTTTAGVLNTNRLEWSSNDRQPTKRFSITLPALADLTKNTVIVKLVPEGIRAVTGKGDVDIVVVAADAPAFAVDTITEAIPQYVNFSREITVSASPDASVTITKLSGALPSGITAKYDKTLGAVVLAGVPSKAGQYEAVYQVKQVLNRVTTVGYTLHINLNVLTLDTLNANTAIKRIIQTSPVLEDVMTVDANDVTNFTQRVRGVLTMTLSPKGKLSAKYINAQQTVSFSGSAWSAFEEASSNVTAEVLSKNGYSLAVRLQESGVVDAMIADPNVTDENGHPKQLSVVVSDAVWSKTNLASRYAGYYTISLGQNGQLEDGNPDTVDCPVSGSGYLTLTLSSTGEKTGKMSYAGCLPDGKKISGSSVLMPGASDEDDAWLPIFVKSSGHVVSALLRVRADGAETYSIDPWVVHAVEDVHTLWAYADTRNARAFTLSFDVFGGYYSSAIDLLEAYEVYESAGPLQVRVLGDSLAGSAVYGPVQPLPAPLNLSVTNTAIKLVSGQDNPLRLSFSLTRKTGLFKGSFRVAFADKTLSASYAGVLLPGWTDCGCGDGVDVPEKPMGLGAFWFTDKALNAADKQISVLRGAAVDLEKVQ